MTEWTTRVVTEEEAAEIRRRTPRLSDEVGVIFLGKPIPAPVLRRLTTTPEEE